VHLVGFIIRIYHDARSSECQIKEMLMSYLKNAGIIDDWNWKIVNVE